MTNELRELIEKLRKLNNQDRCLWLLDEYPLKNKEYFVVFQIIPHFSWGRKERKILMKYYLSKLPFSSERPYLVFLKIAPLREFLEVLSETIDSKIDDDLNLLHYHLDRIFKYEINEKEYEKNKSYIKEIMQKIEESINRKN